MFASLIVAVPLARPVGCKCDAVGETLLVLTSSFFRVLMLRQKASPTDTKLRVECSHLVNEALEMIPVECLPEYLSNGSIPSTSTDVQAFFDMYGPAS
jgi:hypothetical protein